MSHLSGLFILVGTALAIAIVGAVVERACGLTICKDDEEEEEEEEGEGEQCKGQQEV